MSGLILEFLPAAGHALVVGGGKIATRKVRNLAEAGVPITVVAPTVADDIRLAPHVTVVAREYRDGDLDLGVGFALVFACTDSRDVNRRVGAAARARGIPVLVADRQAESTFFTPAVLRDGGVAVAVSTGGASPAVARLIRERIVAALGPGWGRILAAARSEREARLHRARASSEDPGDADDA